MKVAVVGCCNGDLDRVYESLRRVEDNHGIAIDLLICCGDFQAVRDEEDLESLAVKNKSMKDFHKYYSGAKTAHVTTLFIGGLHEPPDLLRQHYYGGWVAPKIFYLGYAGVVRVGHLRIAGLSGTFRARDYFTAHHEFPPYDEHSRFSAHNVREWDVVRLERLAEPVDILISQDWPRGIWKHGNIDASLADNDIKGNLRRDMDSNVLGSPAAMDLLQRLKPAFWFSGQLQLKFPAMVSHKDGTFTRFLAVDRCIPNRDFLQVLDIDPQSQSFLHSLPPPESGKGKGKGKWKSRRRKDAAPPLHYDAEWLAVQKVNHENISFSAKNEKSTVAAPKKEDIAWVVKRMRDVLGAVPLPTGGGRRHPSLLPLRLREAGDTGSLHEFSTAQLRELYETRGLDFPGHLDKASLVRKLEEHDEFFAAERNAEREAAHEAFVIPENFKAERDNPVVQRRALLELLELSDVWEAQEEKRRQAMNKAAEAEAEDYDPFSEAPAPHVASSPRDASDDGGEGPGDGGDDAEDDEEAAGAGVHPKVEAGLLARVPTEAGDGAADDEALVGETPAEQVDTNLGGDSGVQDLPVKTATADTLAAEATVDAELADYDAVSDPYSLEDDFTLSDPYSVDALEDVEASPELGEPPPAKLQRTE